MARARSGSRTTRWCAGTAASWTTPAFPTRRSRCSCARRTPMRASSRSIPLRRALRKGVLAVLTAADMKEAGLKTAGRHPPIKGRGGEGSDPAVPANARWRTCPAMSATPSRWSSPKQSARRRTPPISSRSNTRSNRPSSRHATRSSRTHRSFILTRRAISRSTGRARSTAPTTSARSTRSSRARRMSRALPWSTSA